MVLVFQLLAPLRLLCTDLVRAPHVVVEVFQLDQSRPSVLHAAIDEVAIIFLRLVHASYAAGESVYDGGHSCTEDHFDMLQGNYGVFNDVMEDGGDQEFFDSE